MPSQKARDALNTVTNAHAKCLLLRHLFQNAEGVVLKGEEIRGLGHIFNGLMADLEGVMSDLDPA